MKSTRHPLRAYRRARDAAALIPRQLRAGARTAAEDRPPTRRI